MSLHSRCNRRMGETKLCRTSLIVCLAIAALTPLRASSAPSGSAKKSPSGVVAITLHPAAVAIHDEVSIGDVATVEGGDAALRTRIINLDLADAPALGKTTRLTHDLIRHRIRIAGIDARRYRIQGAESVTLSSRGYLVPDEEIVGAAKQFLLKRLPWNADDIAIELTRPIRSPVQVPGGREDIRFAVSLNAPRVALGSVRVDVAVLSKGSKQAEVPVVFEVHLCQKIAVASRRIDRGQLLASEDIYYERRAVDNVAGYLTEPDSQVGQRAKRAILPLQSITKSDLDSAEPDSAVIVRQRDAVKLVARAGNLVVTATGEALQDGRSGQMIRVRNIDSKTVVTGRVVNRNEVQVLY